MNLSSSNQSAILATLTDLLDSKFAGMEAKINYISSTETSRELEMTLTDPDNYREQYVFKLSLHPKLSPNETADRKDPLHFDPKLGFQSGSNSVPGPNVPITEHLEEWV